MTTRPVPTDRSRRSRRPVPAAPRDALPARTALGVLLLALLLLAAVGWPLLRAPTPAPIVGPAADIVLSGAVLARIAAPADGVAIGAGSLEFVHRDGPWPLRLRAELPPRTDGAVADLPIAVELLDPDGGVVRRFETPRGSVAATGQEIILSGTLYDERSDALQLAARFGR